MSIERSILDLPKVVVSIIGVSLGILVLTVLDEPKSACVGQIELLKKTHQGFLFPQQKKNGITIPPRYKSEIEHCKFGNGMGGCFGFFQSVKGFVRETALISPQCKEEFAEIKEINELLNESVSLMARLAWGGRAPSSSLLRRGWFQAGDVMLFCELQRTHFNLYGEQKFKSTREKILTSLPGADGLAREKVWSLSLFSQPCPNGNFQTL